MATDTELLALAEQATASPAAPLNGGDYGNPIPPQPGAGPGAQGLDLSGIGTPAQPAPVTPNGGPIPEGPLEVPGDRALPVIDGTAPGAGPASVSSPAALPGPPTMEKAGAALEQARQAEMGVAQSQADAGAAKHDQAQAAADGFGAQAEQARANETALLAERAAHDEGIEKAQAVATAAEDSFKNFKFHDYWADKSTGEKIQARLAMALGGFNARVNGGHNLAAEAIDRAIAQDFAQQKAELGKAEVFAKWKKEGVQDLEGHYKTSLGTLQLAQSAATLSTAEEAKQMLAKSGVPLADAENDVMVKQLVAKGQQRYAMGLETIAKAQAQVALEKAQLNVSRMNASTARFNAETNADNKVTTAEAKKVAAKEKADAQEEGRTIHFADGSNGLAPTPRNVTMIGDRDTQYGDAIQKLRNLKATGKKLPYGADYDNAVLAVAAVTTANSSDKTTAHEAGALKNWGVISDAALNTKIKELEDRRAAFRREYQTKNAPAGEAKAATAPAADTRPSRTLIDQAKARIVADPQDKVAKEFLARFGEQ